MGEINIVYPKYNTIAKQLFDMVSNHLWIKKNLLFTYKKSLDYERRIKKKNQREKKLKKNNKLKENNRQVIFFFFLFGRNLVLQIFQIEKSQKYKGTKILENFKILNKNP